ncbi:MarR family winged helix-turn-helix transcriptional regulator [Leifsonia sp. McL0607]|uniref:MarR family winged helix-turn-helix transcriptional regulator n=1 Tax=Leifsonia sp. McL0607 TaxID=3415672 RepID=UPI003CF28735
MTNAPLTEPADGSVPSAQPRRGAPPRTAFLLAQLGADAADRFAERVASLGLTPREAGAIRVLGRRQGLSQRELAELLGTVPSRLVALVDELETKGYVVRERSEGDRRNNVLTLAPGGKRMLAQLREVAQAHQRDLLAPLDADEQQTFAALLAKLAAASDLTPDGHPGYRR